jgi:hypothetical protein
MFRIPSKSRHLPYPRAVVQLTFQRARTEEEAQTLTCTSKNDVDLERVVEIRRTSAAAVPSFAAAVEHIAVVPVRVAA